MTTCAPDGIESGTLIELNRDLWPGCYYARSDASDVARVEDRTFICSLSKDNAGPTNNWVNPYEMSRKLANCSGGSMAGRTMYVLPFSMGPIGSPMSHDRRPAHRFALRRRQHAHHGAHRPRRIYAEIDKGITSASCRAYASRMPLAAGDLTAMCSAPAIPTSISFTSLETRGRSGPTAPGYGGNALLGKKCFALRKSLLQHCPRRRLDGGANMLILGVEDPQWRENLRRRAAFPSACGKTNFAMLIPPKGFDGWKVWTVGDDIAWIKPDAQGRLRAINPEAGFFGVAPGTSAHTNVLANAMKSARSKSHLHSTTALTPEGGVWWEGMTDEPPASPMHWITRATCEDPHPSPRKPVRKQPIPAPRFASRPLPQCPTIDPAWEDPQGRPNQSCPDLWRPPLQHDAAGLSGVQLERRRSHRRNHGFRGHCRRHRRGVGQVRQAIPWPCSAPVLRLSYGGLLPVHWIKMQAQFIRETPRIFHVQLVPQGLQRQVHLARLQRQHARAPEWDWSTRAHGRALGRETPIGWMPRYEDVEWKGMESFPKEKFDELQAFDRAAWQKEVIAHEELFLMLHDHLPPEMVYERELLICPHGEGAYAPGCFKEILS